MKSSLIALSAIFLLAACGTPAEKGGCAECQKMAVEAKAKHEAAKGEKCACCHKKAK